MSLQPSSQPSNHQQREPEVKEVDFTRLRKACDACSLAHSSCSGEHPRCKRCSARNMTCIYSPVNTPYISSAGDAVTIKKVRRASVGSQPKRNKSGASTTSCPGTSLRTESGSSTSTLSSPISPVTVKIDEAFEVASPQLWPVAVSASASGPLSAPISPTKLSYFDDSIGPIRTPPRRTSINRAERPHYMDLSHLDAISTGLATPGLSGAFSGLGVDSPTLTTTQMANLSHLFAFPNAAPPTMSPALPSSTRGLQEQGLLQDQQLLLQALYPLPIQAVAPPIQPILAQAAQAMHASRLKQDLVELKMQQDKLDSMRRNVEANLAQVESSLPMESFTTPSPSKSIASPKIRSDYIDGAFLCPQTHREKNQSSTASPTTNTVSAQSSVAGTPANHDKLHDPFITQAVADVDLEDYVPVEHVAQAAVSPFVRFPSDDSLDKFNPDND